jgi:hypothetical protein
MIEARRLSYIISGDGKQLTESNSGQPAGRACLRRKTADATIGFLINGVYPYRAAINYFVASFGGIELDGC